MNVRAVNGEVVADALNSAMIHLLRRAAREDVAAGIGPAQLSALSVLVFGGDTTLGRLAHAEQVRPPTMTRIVAALEQAGLELRRLREGPTHPGGPTRQAFFRMGEVILEVIEARGDSRMREEPDRPARLWGLAFGVEDLDHTARQLDDLLGEPRDAVQPGRRIATARRDASLGTAVAFITPGPGGA